MRNVGLETRGCAALTPRTLSWIDTRRGWCAFGGKFEYERDHERGEVYMSLALTMNSSPFPLAPNSY